MEKVLFFCKKYAVFVILLLGILLRLYFYLKGFSFYYDEGALALNLIERGYAGLFKGLDYLQVAPPLFLVLSKFLMNISPECLKDYALRLIPMVSGIAAIPLFYQFLRMYTKDRTVRIASIFLFCFNTTAVLYCGLFKQYSLELFISVILMIIFYRLIFLNKYKWYYSLIIAVVPWFSLSSLIIIGSYFWFMLFTSRKNILKIYLPFFASFLLFYFLSLKSISSVNYSGMNDWWNNGYGFFDIRHPMRIAIRTGEFFCFNKYCALFCGLVILCMSFCSALKLNFKKVFIILPIILTCLTSTLQLYPMLARLFLFLLPYFVIIIASYNWKFKKFCLVFVSLLSLITCIACTANPHTFLTSSKEVVQLVENKIKPDEKIIFDAAYHRYLYYLNDRSNVIFLEENCEPYTNACNQKLDSLPDGKYYLVLKINPEEMLSKNLKVLNTYNLYSSVIYFKKGGS